MKGFIKTLFSILFIIAIFGWSTLFVKDLSKIRLNSNTPASSNIQGASQTGNVLTNREIFTAVNSYRSNNKLSEYNWDDESCKIANDILNNNFWKTDYNIKNYYDVCPLCFDFSIAQGRDYYSTDTIINSWKDNVGTLETLKYSGKNGCVAYSNGNVVLVTVKKSAPNHIDESKVVTTSENVVPTNNPDLVNCKVNSNCGGGYRLMTKSECNNSICCEIDEKWYLYSSVDKCTNDQKQSNYNYESIIYPTFAPLPTIVPYYTPTPDPIIEQQRLANIQTCKDYAKSKYDDAKQDCYNVSRGYGVASSSWTQQCLQTAQNDYNYQLKLCE